MTVLLDLNVLRAKNGYRFATSDDGEFVLDPIKDSDGNCEMEAVSLVGDHSGLFLDFCSLVPSISAFLSFSNKYGELLPGGAFEAHLLEHRMMGFLVEVWRAVRSTGRSPVLNAHFKSDERGEIALPTIDGRRAKPGTPGGLLVWTAKVKAKPRAAARLFLQEAMTVRLASVRPRVSLLESGIAIQAPRLLDTLWLQFAFAIAESREFRACATCARFFQLRPDVNRTSRTYCSDACRVKAFRIRHGQPIKTKADK